MRDQYPIPYCSNYVIALLEGKWSVFEFRSASFMTKGKVYSKPYGNKKKNRFVPRSLGPVHINPDKSENGEI